MAHVWTGPEIHLWRIDLGDPDWDAMSVARGRNRPQASRRTWAAAQRLLARYLGARPETLEFAEGPQGKPQLAGEPIAFNLSHSAANALIAVSTSSVGVDVERMDPSDATVATLVDLVLHPEDVGPWRASEPREQVRSFYRAWVRKEAYLKLLGVGLHRTMTDLQIANGPIPGRSIVRDCGEPGRAPSHLYDFDLGPLDVAAVCSPIATARVTVRPLQPAAVAGDDLRV